MVSAARCFFSPPLPVPVPMPLPETGKGTGFML